MGELAVFKPGKVRIVLDINVRCPELLIEFAKEQYSECWGDASWEPTNISEAVLEALVISNMNPSPDEYGIEIAKFSHEILNKEQII